MNDIGFLFDLDGVLIDSESQYSLIWARINKEFPTGIENLEIIIKGCTLDKILTQYFKKEDRDTVRKRLHQLESEMKYDFLPGAKEFLTLLKEKRIPVALVTSSDEKKMSHLKEEIPDIMNYFDFIVTAGLVTESKPSPQGYLLAAENLNCKPQNCVVFEDSLQGVMAGKNAGAFVVGIYGTLPKEKISPFSDFIVGNLSEINLEELIRILKER